MRKQCASFSTHTKGQASAECAGPEHNCIDAAQVRLILPGELAKHAVSEGTKAVTKFTSAAAK
jgi:hypothetical protein